MKKRITKCWVFVLALTMILISLPQNMLITKAEENMKDVIAVSGGDLMAEVKFVDEQTAQDELVEKFANEQIEEELPLYLGATGGLSAEVSNGAVDLLISTQAELKSFADSVRMGDTFAGRLVKLGADIAFDGITVNNFTPIGSADYAFEGTFDGAGYTISGLVIVEDSQSTCCGLFRKIASSGVVKNVTLSNSKIICTDECYVGGITGLNEGSIYNCTLENTVVTNNYSKYGDQYTGGIAARNVGTIDMCRTLNGEIGSNTTYSSFTDYEKYLGGIVGYCTSSGKIRSSLNTAKVYAGSYGFPYMGGVCGYLASGEVTNCANTGMIEWNDNDSHNEYIGGIVGYANGSAVVQLSYNTGDVSFATSTHYGFGYLGALVGYYTGSTVISHCYYSNALEGGNKDTSSSATVINNTSMDLADMKLTTFADLLNTKVAANADWLPWEIRAGLDYPQHVSVYAVSLADDISGGSLSVDRSFAYAGLTVNFTVTPDEFYRISEVKVTDANGAIVEVNGTNGSYSFTMPATDVMVDVDIEFVEPQFKAQTVSLKETTGKGLKISWVKDNIADGYLVEYSKDKKNWSSRKVYGGTTNSTTLSGLTVGTVYYVRVRAYINANNTTYYGDYSSVQSGKVKGFVTEAYTTLSKTSYEYDGKAKTPTVKITYGGKTLKKGTDYTVKYTNNKKVGTAKVTITGKGNYTGTLTKTFKITKITPTFTGKTNYIKKQGDKAFTLNTKLKKGKTFTKLTYKSSNTKVATVNNAGKVTIKKAGKAVIIITAKGNSYCNKATRKVTITVKARK